MLAYALIGYLQRLLVHGVYTGEAIPCDVCESPFICGKCRPLYTDAFDLFGAPAIFDLEGHPDMPTAIIDVLLQIDEYEHLPPEILTETVRRHIDGLLDYLAREPENDMSLRRVIFKLLDADRISS